MAELANDSAAVTDLDPEDVEDVREALANRRAATEALGVALRSIMPGETQQVAPARAKQRRPRPASPESTSALRAAPSAGGAELTEVMRTAKP